MFVLTSIHDTLKILPAEFRKSREEAIKDEINRKYSNRVLHDVGLCMLVHDLVEIDEGYVQHSEGWIWIKVHFRMAVFRPFRDEILVGKVRSASPAGVQISIGFFDDISVPAEMMPQGCEFDATEGVWVWRYEGNDLFMDLDEDIRFRVLRVDFLDVNPPRGEKEGVKPPYQLVCGINDSGLGLLSWWGE
ncbi:hypothetical protein DL89DRAFT_265984 [Linderina pennispora]|uniref:DNA-directed RNA polymerase III subunit RPC8 n=1 Tax=Linderina pennispora TaxID=61395 RepID=A0A1Y1WFY4_9FUNG|nr:uncharacterized protein DL89DRAFT_265984 [Linderina pennispora]KAJ1958665.1 DNA-directed RNA polymerase III complex subunit Rpc25 [Linderina pennispora]ORX72433.1 hypothetical protein DL89DRAFT_265984 [Linderina pennispora]